MHGIKRILVFCTLTTILPIILLVTPLYLRHNFYANVAYAVTDSDILEITDGISPIFCSGHTLQMNRTFNAFQMKQKPEATSYRKHIRLKKNMTLPDDTLEYWGFYLLKGASVALSVCSRFQGASILVVKGERNLQTCGMLEHHSTQAVKGIFLPEARKQVKVTFQSNTEEVQPDNNVTRINYNGMSSDIDSALLRNLTTDNADVNILDLYSHAKGSLVSNREQKEDTPGRANASQIEAPGNARRLRHARGKQHRERMKRRKDMVAQQSLHGTEGPGSLKREDRKKRGVKSETKIDRVPSKRLRRSQDLVKPTFLLDQGVKHGGNAGKNTTDAGDESSVSSFENELFTCYGGSILIAQEFAPSEKCTDVSYLINGKHMQAVHNVVEAGYYYYIFYSDNDIVSNDLYALFDIYKPVFHYENVTTSCVNETKCSFAINLLSSDMVIVEIPTMDNMEHEIDDVNLLLSICHPRMEVYIIFPIAVLFFILACAFM